MNNHNSQHKLNDLAAIHKKLDQILRILGGDQLVAGDAASSIPTVQDKKALIRQYEGARGGISFLIDDGFFNAPRSFSTVVTELKTRGYHYPRTSVQPVLTSMIRPGGRLVRLKEGRNYIYVVRK